MTTSVPVRVFAHYIPMSTDLLHPKPIPLAEVIAFDIRHATEVERHQERYEYTHDRSQGALRAVVELHEPRMGMFPECYGCEGEEALGDWPCETFLTIERALTC